MKHLDKFSALAILTLTMPQGHAQMKDMDSMHKGMDMLKVPPGTRLLRTIQGFRKETSPGQIHG
jgi:hypothetical protein